MSLGPPCPISTETIVIKPEYLETILRAPESPLLTNNPYPPKVVTLRDKGKLVIRQARREEAPSILKVIKPYFDVEMDFYDIVAARTYAEILAWYRHRIKDHYLLIGTKDGVLVGL
ncbi:MAG: N-acetyltransferase, partial [Aigarchaeota archaeon]|nr:N-acetyltransferase [Aigarchaeota archaeon]